MLMFFRKHQKRVFFITMCHCTVMPFTLHIMHTIPDISFEKSTGTNYGSIHKMALKKLLSSNILSPR